MSKTMMTVNEVAAYLSCAPATVYRLARAHTLPAMRVGREWRFPKAAIDEWRSEKGEAVAKIVREPKKKRTAKPKAKEKMSLAEWAKMADEVRAMIGFKNIDSVKLLREIREERAARAFRTARGRR
jgi:excisionase family DNA binding protein